MFDLQKVDESDSYPTLRNDRAATDVCNIRYYKPSYCFKYMSISVVHRLQG